MEKSKVQNPKSTIGSLPQIKFGKSEIEQRCFDYSLRIVNMASVLPKNFISTVLGKQILRSGTSVGANVAEAHCAFSKNEFSYSMNIAKKEAKETLFWLYLMVGSGILPEIKTRLLIQETDELLRILSKAVLTSRNNNKKEKV
jgi:four helix bundle protein